MDCGLLSVMITQKSGVKSCSVYPCKNRKRLENGKARIKFNWCKKKKIIQKTKDTERLTSYP